MRSHLGSNDANIAIWSGVALITLYAFVKLYWVVLPTGLLSAYSSADGWQLPRVSKNLAFFRDMSSEVLKVPVWYLEYGYFYAIISAAAWLWTAVVLALRKPYALRVLLLLSAFSIAHGIAISFIVREDDAPFPWRAVAFYLALAVIFTRRAVRAQYVPRHA